MLDLVLQITENKIPLRLNDVAIVLLKIKDEYIRDAAQEALSSSCLVPHKCDNKVNTYFNKFVGGGICLAKKYKRLGVSPDLICQDCQSPNIVKTLNYIFDRYFSGRYYASWKAVKRVVSAKPERKTRAERIKDEGDVSAKERNQQILAGLGSNSGGRISGRVASSLGNASSPKVSDIPNGEKGHKSEKGRGRKSKKTEPVVGENIKKSNKSKGFQLLDPNAVNKKVGGK